METIQNLKAQQVEGCAFVFATQTGRHLSYRNLLATRYLAAGGGNSSENKITNRCCPMLSLRIRWV